MRFYSEVRIDLQSYSDEIRCYPSLVFSTDFLYHLSRLEGVAWSPIQLKPFPYLPHPMSPCTTNVVKAMQLAIVKSDLNYQLIYEELVPDDADNKLELFIDRARDILGTMTENPMDAFFNLLHLGRWTVTFYDNGTRDAAYLAPYLMDEALKKVIKNLSILEWFGKLNEVAETLADLLESGHAEGILEEAYRYYEELYGDYENNFDECSACVCGHCKDLFEECEECDKEAGERDLEADLEDEDDLDIYGEFESSYTESDEISGAAENEEN